MVFHELVWFFKSRNIPLARTNIKVKEYLTNGKTTFIPCAADDILFASARMKNHREYNDLVILSAAVRTGLALYSFDEELRSVARRHGVKLFKGS